MRDGDKIVCYLMSGHILVGSYKRVLPSNGGIALDVELNNNNMKYTSRLEVEAVNISAFGKLVGEYGVQTIDDGKLNEVISKHDH